MSRQAFAVVTVTVEDREDGGLRVFSDDLPGLILSGPDRANVCELIAPAIQVLFKNKGYEHVSVHPARPLKDVLKSASPRDVDVHVQQEQFVVEMPQAA